MTHVDSAKDTMERDTESTEDLLYADLFSGAGGMSLGFEEAGFQCVGALDKNKKAAKTYESNIGIEPVVGDITEFDAEDLLDEFGVERGELDVLISCAPCQGFSQHRNKHNIEHDERNTLVSLSAELMVEMEPEFFVMENVPELVRGSKEKYWDRTYEILKRAGYLVRFDVLNAADFGVPQRRNRAIIVARKEGRKVELPAPTVENHQTVRDAIVDLPPVEAGETHPSDPMHRAPNHTQRIINMLGHIPNDGGSWMDIPEPHQEEYWLDSMKKRARNDNMGSFCDTYGRMHWDRPSGTITRKSSTPSCGRYVHPEQDRNITVREAARLQSFPDWWNFEGPFVSWYEQNGNAVPPKLAEAIASKLRELAPNREKGTRQMTFESL
ncbi:MULTISPECIES: DNA cytosine methyltransferase [Haloferax]|uniref:DNA (cytosine-5-)-methyltransferase n=1 Tax=Haloferax marinum TaxID=2666143 RepID=A0A6A8G8P8_9EURY|nr:MULTISPECIES: DNA cytosine methyltransferase [Haloferax]KAB1198438.1 DNA cytosine methyltransferase [Haloferax sp. CBA1150]MRW97539.1 DNA (cytosine-5-)-methyltransferase [Haloferax marinum]